MKVLISLLTVIILAIGAGWFPFATHYQDVVYQRDRSKYDTEKAQWDSIQSLKFTHVKDSVFKYWISHNDTTLKQIKKITKRPTYDETGYYAKNGKWQCEPESRYSSKLVCEPMKVWVTTNYYVSGYYYDTTWTQGYNNRSEWLNKANSIANDAAINQKVSFRPYDGHKYKFIVNRENKNENLYVIGIISYWLCGVGEGYAIWFFIFSIISTIRKRKADYSNIPKYGTACGCVIAFIISIAQIYLLT